MSDLPATVAAASPATYDREKLQLIRDMFAKGATDNEFLVMMELANRYQLDPFSRQIWLRCPTYDFLLHYTQIVVSVRECAHFRGDL